jgi:membrane protease YdiL (CAAX protease family)
MLFLPLFDQGWRIPALPHSRSHVLGWIALLTAALGLLAWKPAQAPFALSALLTAALPEEWFFRAYFMDRLGGGLRGNILASLLFSLLHALTRDWITAALVFAPSLFYGWLYQRSRDLPLLVLVHALSNLLYAMFLTAGVAALVENLRYALQA